MNCPKCQQPNATTARFCQDCGTPLPTSTESARIGAITVDATGGSSVIHVGVPSPSQASGEHCPICGAYKFPNETFRCKQCGRTYICLKHQDEAIFWCQDCVAAAQAQRDAAAKAKRAADEQAQRDAQERARQALTLTLAPGVTMDFVRVPAGNFLMGNTDQRPNMIRKSRSTACPWTSISWVNTR